MLLLQQAKTKKFQRQAKMIFQKQHGHAAAVGKKPSSIYTRWQNMKSRCENPLCAEWKHYGGRGITVCESWKKSFERFLLDMGEPPSGAVLDRINNDGNYEPSNCRWSNNSESQRNRRTARMITHNGKTQNLIAWSEETGLAVSTISNRIKRGWCGERVFGPNTIITNLNLVGKMFGNLRIIEMHGQKYYKCLCLCGNSKIVRCDHLRQHKIRSCGCLRRKRVSFLS